MSGLTTGILVGLALAFFWLAFGFWGFLLALVFAAIGALIGGALSGKLNLRAAVDAARGRVRG